MGGVFLTRDLYLCSVINLYGSTVWIKSHLAVKSEARVIRLGASVLIEGCTFEDNERAITVIGEFAEMRVRRYLG